MSSSSFNAFRGPNANRSAASNDLKHNIRESRWIQPEQWQLPEVEQKFQQGSIDFTEVHGMLQQLGIKVERFELNKILDAHDKNKDRKLSKEEFEELYMKLRAEKDPGSTWNKTVKPIAGGAVDTFKTQRIDEADETNSSPSTIEKLQDTSGPYHSVLVEERVWTANWVNQLLADDAHLNLRANPIDTQDPQALYKRCQDGILLCKLINVAVPKTIDERAINLNLNKQDIFRQSENLELAINSARGIGCKVVNIHPENISKAVPHLIMGLLWQIIRIQLTHEINLKHVPGLVLLLRDGETAEHLLKLSPEDLLLRWFNYQLQRSQYKGKPVSNFSNDIKDSEAYTYLLNVIAPANTKPPLTLNPLNESDLRYRAELMLKESDKIKARAHITPDDVVKGNPRLNFAFVANLFNIYPALDLPTEQVLQPDVVIEETREEKTYRNFINSLGLEPHVNYLYSDLCDGLIILQLYDIIRPNTVDWSKIYKTFNAIKERFQKLNNCNFAVTYAKDPLFFKVTGIGGSNILEGNKTLTLGLVWQIMRAYTLSILQKLAKSSTPIADKDIINWANEKLKSANKHTFLTNFQDPSLSDSMLICDLIDAIKPGSIQYNLLKTSGTSEAKMDNALYAISMARKIGARVYALPEDIVETKQKMLLTVFACLMASDMLAPNETPSNLRLSNSQKRSSHSPASNHITADSPGSSPARRSSIFITNRIQPTAEHIYEKHLPPVRDVPSTFAQQPRVYEDARSRSRSKTPIGTASPKAPQRSLSASISSIFNTLSKRSTENAMGSNGDLNELRITSSRRSRPLSTESGRRGIDTPHVITKQINVTPQKQSIDNGIDSRYATHRSETVRQQQTPLHSARVRLNVPNVHVESPLMHEVLTKEQGSTGPLYQRRTNNSVRSPIKQKIDKYRRRSGEATQGGNGTTSDGHMPTPTTTLALNSPSSVRSKQQASPSSIRRVTSDAETSSRPEVFRLSVDSNALHSDHPSSNGQHRLKPAQIYSTHEQLVPVVTTHITSSAHRRLYQIPAATPIQPRPSNTYGKQRQSSARQSTTTANNQGNMYLAFIASRHLSTLEANVPEYDMDHPRLLRIFTWLQNVEEHRHEQSDHDLLITEQNQRMLDQEENFSLYSEIQHAVDDIPANTNGEPCERIPTIEFEN
ncbi:unnamed protein product [Adineta ricciae]|uniref:Fimbrin n=1 Tax=Adineta ricciae TaxID=249248 RepID=A0A813XBR0_ADIRI|nr:unnamed protein product [Adineta ricciae]CAF1083327.1 unnamed protein product [Adineta ricciae]